MKLDGQIALVTGCGRGIGRGIALAFAREGADLVLASLADTPELQKDLASVEVEVRSLGRRALSVPVDVSQEADVARLAEQVLAEFGRVDVLVNNAGRLILPGDILGTTPQMWDTMMDVNVRGVYLCCRAFLPGMMARHSGRIINIASIAGLRGIPNRAAYCASKHAVVGLTRALAVDLKPYRVAVNAICPGAVDTPLTAYTRPDADKSNWMKPGDIASLALYLASAEAQAMTGAIVEIASWAD